MTAVQTRPNERLRQITYPLIWVAVIFLPLLFLGVEAVLSLLADTSTIALLVPTGRRLGLFLNSLTLSFTVSFAGLIVGVLAGSVLWEWDTGPKSVLRWIVFALAPLPPYIHALSWSTAFSNLNDVLRQAGLAVLPLSGWFIAFVVDFMTYLPYGVGFALLGLLAVETPAVDAARLVRPDWDVFLRVVLPLAAPALISAGGIIFVFTLTDYSVPTLFSVNVYALEIFSDFSATSEAARAMLLSVPLILVAMIALKVSQDAIRDTVQSSSVSQPSLRLVYPPWFRVLQYAGLAVGVLQFTVLVTTLVSATGSLSSLSFAVSSAWEDLGFSFMHSLLTGVLCLPFALLAAEQLKQGDSAWWLMVVAPLGVPAPLIGISLIKLFSGMGFIYGTVTLTVLGTLIRFTSLASLIVLAQLRRNDPLLFDAADVFKPSRLRGLTGVKLPLQAPGIIGAAAIVFAFTMGELGVTLLTVPPGSETVTIRVFNYLHYGGSDVVAGLCLMLAAVMLGVGLIGVAAFGSRSGRVKK